MAYTHLNQDKRYQIHAMRKQGINKTAIAWAADHGVVFSHHRQSPGAPVGGGLRASLIAAAGATHCAIRQSASPPA